MPLVFLVRNMKLFFGLAVALAGSFADASDSKEAPLTAPSIVRIEQTLREARDNHDISEQLYELNLSFVHDNQCKAISRAFTLAERVRWSSIVSENRDFAGAKAVESFVSSSWRVVYAIFPNSEPAFLFFRGLQPIATWSGGAAIFDAPEVEKWVLKNVPGIPRRLAHCFAWHVTFNRDQ